MLLDDGEKTRAFVKKLLYDVLKLLSHIITASQKNRSDVAESAKKIYYVSSKIFRNNFITTFGENCKNLGKIPKLITIKNM